MKSKLLIVGASGHGKVVADMALEMDQWTEIAFSDYNEKIKTVKDFKVLGTFEKVSKYINDYDVFIAVGKNETRAKLFQKVEELNASIPTIIHPKAIIANDVEIG